MIQLAKIIKEWLRLPQSLPDPGSNAMMDVNKSLNIAEVYWNYKAAGEGRSFFLWMVTSRTFPTAGCSADLNNPANLNS